MNEQELFVVQSLIEMYLNEYDRETPFHERWNFITNVDTNEIRVGQGGRARSLLCDLIDDYPTHHRYHR